MVPCGFSSVNACWLWKITILSLENPASYIQKIKDKYARLPVHVLRSHSKKGSSHKVSRWHRSLYLTDGRHIGTVELCVLDSTHSILRLPHVSLCSLCLSLELQKSHQGLSLLVKVMKLWLPKVTWLHVLCPILSKPGEANHGALLFTFWKLTLFSPSN